MYSFIAVSKLLLGRLKVFVTNLDIQSFETIQRDLPIVFLYQIASINMIDLFPFADVTYRDYATRTVTEKRSRKL